MEPPQDGPNTSEHIIQAAGEWLVNLCSVKASTNYRDQFLTPLEQLKFDEFFVLHGQSPTFKRYHVEAVRRCLSRDIMPEYQLARALLERDDEKCLFADENDVLQVAIKRAKVEPGLLGKSPLESNPELLKMVRLLMDHGAAVNCSDGDGYSPLYYACVLGYADLFHFLLSSGADISIIQKRNVPQQVTELRKTSANPSLDGMEERVNLLQVTLDALISPQNIVNMDWVGWPPGVNYDKPLWALDIEPTWGGIILYLLQQELSFTKDDLGLVMLLHIACTQGSLNHVEELLDYGVVADIPGPRMIDGGQGEGSTYGTAMHAAASGRRLDVTKALISNGESPALRRPCLFGHGWTNTEMTPIEVAISAGQHGDDEDLQNFLRSFISEAKGLEDTDLKAVLDWCVKSNRLDFAKELLQRGVDLDQVPLGVRGVEMAQLLIAHDIKIDAAGIQQESLRRNHLDLLRWSVDKYGPLLPQDPASWGKMALRLVDGYLTHIKIIKYLIDEYPGPHIDSVLVSPFRKSKNVEVAKETSWLYLAIYRGNIPAVRLLLEAGADPRCPGLSKDAAMAMRKCVRYTSHKLSQQLEVITMIQERLSSDGKWVVPSLAEIRCRIAEAVAAQGQALDENVKHLIENRQEVPQPILQSRRDSMPLSTLSITPTTNLYKPLASSSSFRLLELLPSAKRTDTLAGRLVNSDITFQPDFEALSYVWGDISPIKYISIDGNEIAITPNLHSALIHLRSADSVRTIWVDAICINQSFHEERNQQVRVMGDIYKSAKQVIVWLGEAADDSHLVFEHLNDDSIKDSFPNYPEPLEAKRKAWNALIRRPWFFRTWVIQEIALARRAVIMCGEDTTLWRNVDEGWKPDFSGGAKGLSKKDVYPGNQSDHPISGFDGDSHVWRLRLLGPESDPMSILSYSRVCGTTEVRDKVYGILGLFKPGFVEVDYDLPVETIFRQFAEAVIKLTGNLDILKHAGVSQKYEGLPSWVPDFSETSTRSLHGYDWYAPWRENAEDHYGVRFADGMQISVPREDLARKYLPGLAFSADRSLKIKGKMIDSIRTVGVELPRGTSHAPGTVAFAHVIKEWETLAATLIPDWKTSPDPSVSHAFATTLSATHGNEIFNVDLGFTQWYRHCGASVLEKADPSMFLRDREFYLWWSNDKTTASGDDKEEGLGYHIREFSDRMIHASYGRCLFTTGKGSMGLGSSRVKAGDRIVYFPGSSEPFILRMRKDGKGWTLVGDCYLYGLDIDELFCNKEHLGEEFIIF